MLKTYYHPGFAVDIGPHVMPMGKFALVADALRDRDWLDLIEPPPAGKHDLLRVHDAAYIDAVQTGEPRTLAESQKFPWSPALWPSVLLTNGGCIAAARAAVQDGSAAALASGFHHSHASRGEGFCTFNGLVVAGEALRAAGEIKSVAILDMDLHYGNGTAILAATRPWITAISIYGNDYWDNVAYRDVGVRAHEDGENHLSFPLRAGCDREEMLRVMGLALPEILRNGKPDLLLYQAGADPFFEDPFSPLKLDHDDLLARDRRVFELARSEKIPIAWVLAGGYTKDTSKVVRVHVNTFDAWRDVYSA